MISCVIHNSFIEQNVDRRTNKTRRVRRDVKCPAAL